MMVNAGSLLARVGYNCLFPMEGGSLHWLQSESKVSLLPEQLGQAWGIHWKGKKKRRANFQSRLPD